MAGTCIGAPKYDIEAALAALSRWRPGMPFAEMRDIVMSCLNYASRETRARYARAIFGAFIPHTRETVSEENSLTSFVQKVSSRKARVEALFYYVLLHNPTLTELCIFMSGRFPDGPIARQDVKGFLGNLVGSGRGAIKTTEKAFGILRDFGLISNSGRDTIRWRPPEHESLAYILYHNYMSRGIVAPDIGDVLPFSGNMGASCT